MTEVLPRTVDGVAPTRPAPNLREQQRLLTRSLLIDAFARVVLRDGPSDVSLPAVADEAGCSVRTLYRHFASREALVEGLDEEFRAFMAGILADRDDDDLASYVSAIARAGSERETLARAWSALGRDRVTLGLVHGHVTDRIRQAVDAAAPDLGARDRVRAVGALRVIVNSNAWFGLTDALGREAAAETAAWMVRTLISALPSIAADPPDATAP